MEAYLSYFPGFLQAFLLFFHGFEVQDHRIRTPRDVCFRTVGSKFIFEKFPENQFFLYFRLLGSSGEPPGSPWDPGDRF